MQWNKQNDLQKSIKEMRKKIERGAKNQRQLPKKKKQMKAMQILNKQTRPFFMLLFVFVSSTLLCCF